MNIMFHMQLICIENLISQNSERRMLKQWAADTKEELSLANKELTAVSKWLIFSEMYNHTPTICKHISLSLTIYP